MTNISPNQAIKALLLFGVIFIMYFEKMISKGNENLKDFNIATCLAEAVFAKSGSFFLVVVGSANLIVYKESPHMFLLLNNWSEMCFFNFMSI